jgi:Zn-dependent peptidase ImmA (M78 family)
MYNLNIEKHEVSSRAVYLKSMVLRYSDGRALILVRLNLPDAEKRFCVVKELCNLFLDEKEDWSTNAYQTIDGLIRIFGLTTEQSRSHVPENDVLVCEQLAELAAAELLYPFQYRHNDMADLEAGLTTVAKLALSYDVPVRVIRLALNPTNLALSKKYHAKPAA